MLEGETAPSEGSELVTAMITSAVGGLFSFTVNVACCFPSSDVSKPITGSTVTPGVSLSILAIGKVTGYCPS